MKITHKIDEFLPDLFPGTQGDASRLVEEAESYFAQGGLSPQVSIEYDQLVVAFSGKMPRVQDNQFKKAIRLCDEGKFPQAITILRQLIESAPNISECHRVLGQAYSELGDQDEARKHLINALRWDPMNGWALIMMGNIMAKYLNNAEQALKYYNRVLKLKPDDNFALNNIGAKLVELGKLQEATTYFEKAQKADPDYPNTYYGLACVAELEGDHQGAFENSITAMFKNDKKNQLYSLSFQMAEKSAKELVARSDMMGLVSDYVSELKEKTDKDIVVERDPKIPTAAKIEIAENYNRDYHLVKYKPDYPAVEHLIMHELSHLELTADARRKNSNLLFITKNQYQEAFIKSFEKDIKKLIRQGFPEDRTAGYFSELFQGINRQAYNTPIDLFIEDMLYKKYRQLRPYQFLSLLNMVLEGIDATTRKEIVKMVPQKVLSVSKVYNLVNALHLKSLFAIDLVRAHKPSNKEMRLASNLYQEFREYRFERAPGKEFHLVQRWAELMNIDRYFDLVPEALHRTKPVQDDSAAYSERKTADIESPSPKDMTRKFIEEHSSGDVNMAVCMYMIGALKYFEQFPREGIKKIAYDIAMVGTQGIDPNKQGYTVPSIEGKTFSGYHLLAYYYVSWALAEPEMLSKLQLPFDKEYEIARKFHDMDNA